MSGSGVLHQPKVWSRYCLQHQESIRWCNNKTISCLNDEFCVREILQESIFLGRSDWSSSRRLHVLLQVLWGRCQRKYLDVLQGHFQSKYLQEVVQVLKKRYQYKLLAYYIELGQLLNECAGITFYLRVYFFAILCRSLFLKWDAQSVVCFVSSLFRSGQNFRLESFNQLAVIMSLYHIQHAQTSLWSFL